jgi:hypothetical protein
MPSEALVRQMMVEWSGMAEPAREKLLAALLAYKVSREVKGANLVMDPKFAQILDPLLQDEVARDAAIEALIRLDKSREQREKADSGARPTEVSVVLFASTPRPLDESDSSRYAQEVLGAKYGEAPGMREFQFVTIPDLDPHLTLNEDIARAYYSRLVELPQGRDFGAPDDGYAGKAKDGTPVAALFFWHGSTGGKKKRKLFGRR